MHQFDIGIDGRIFISFFDVQISKYLTPHAWLFHAPNLLPLF